MKRPLVITLAILFYLGSIAQNHIQVSEQSTLHIICPAAVTYVQVGSHTKLLAEAVPAWPNMVRVKAITSFKDSTSLTILCVGKLYGLIVSYEKHSPLQLKLMDFHGDKLKELPDAEMPLHKVLDSMEKLKRKECTRKPIRTRQSKQIELSLDDIRLKDDLLFIRLTIYNHSGLIYKTTTPSFLMRDKKPKKAANVQEYLIEPKRASSSQLSISPKAQKTMVLAFKSFTIPQHKQMEISLQEGTEGYTGRNLRLTLTDKDILKAPVL
ncbi:DUF4138 domain-containing protein [Carboxylicivirga sp. RSCT41]|uniref:DUF4138 domain-containing protein n=1 Tax=Carboxylicivirga agarovorans TaxID=3417570 RepID=UPI003D355BA8